MQALVAEAGLALARTRASAELAEALERERLIAHISRKVRTLRDLDELLRVAVEETAEGIRADRCFIRLGEPGEQAPLSAQWVAAGVAPLEDLARLPVDEPCGSRAANVGCQRRPGGARADRLDPGPCARAGRARLSRRARDPDRLVRAGDRRARAPPCRADDLAAHRDLARGGDRPRDRDRDRHEPAPAREHAAGAGRARLLPDRRGAQRAAFGGGDPRCGRAGCRGGARRRLGCGAAGGPGRARAGRLVRARRRARRLPPGGRGRADGVRSRRQAARVAPAASTMAASGRGLPQAAAAAGRRLAAGRAATGVVGPRRRARARLLRGRGGVRRRAARAGGAGRRRGARSPGAKRALRARAPLPGSRAAARTGRTGARRRARSRQRARPGRPPRRAARGRGGRLAAHARERRGGRAGSDRGGRERGDRHDALRRPASWSATSSRPARPARSRTSVPIAASARPTRCSRPAIWPISACR